MRSVIPMHFTRKKRSGITFFNKETAIWLDKYLQTRDNDSDRLFVVSDRQWKKIWKQTSESAGVNITSKVLRAWFSTEMGELGVPDRFIDIFQGRAPRSVLAKHFNPVFWVALFAFSFLIGYFHWQEKQKKETWLNINNYLINKQ